MPKKDSPAVAAVETREQAEQLLARKGALQGEAKRLKGTAQQKIVDIRERLADDLAPIEEEIAEIDAALEAWTEANLDGKRKSLKLATGTVGFKLTPPKIELRLTAKSVVTRIKEAGLAHCLRVEEAPDLNALANLSSERLRELGCRRKAGERRFFARPKGDTR